MSVKFTPVQWTFNKWWYDAALLAAVIGYVIIYVRIGTPAAGVAPPIDGAIVRMRAFGTCAFLMLTVLLCIGPLARLDARMLPFLYNRRHFGVLTAAVAAVHASFVLGWYFAFSPIPPLEGLFAANTAVDRVVGFPFEWLGVAALLILFVLAATSHDFWMKFLTPPVWKGLHLSIYLAYALVVAHVGLGSLQDAEGGPFGAIYVAGPLLVASLHVAALFKERGARWTDGDWVAVTDARTLEDGRAKVVRVGPNERAAVFRIGDTLSAVSNACAHQNGPLGEGRVVSGCITCPWHGFQYRPQDGCAPPPFTEKIPTYRLRLDGERVMLYRRANPPGTYVEPLRLPEAVL